MKTIYTVRSKKSKHVWEFKYHLNGHLSDFKILEGVLTQKQYDWLFKAGNFPINEREINVNWIPNLKENFEIEIGDIDLSFEAFWDAYANKKGKLKQTRNIWDRMSKAHKIKALQNIPVYNHYLKYYPQQQKMYPSTYLNQESYLNEWKL